MNRFKTAAAAFLVASFVGLQPAAALADGTQRRYDDQRDRREEQRDRREQEQRERREEQRRAREEQRDRRNYRFNTGRGAWDPKPHYRNDDRRYRDRRMSRADVIYRGSDDRYYCRRDDGTTGLIVGGIAGGVLGNIVARERSKTLGTIIGAGAGAIIGQQIDRGDIVCR